MNKQISEAVDVNTYKALLASFGDYTKSFPCTGVDNLFNALIDCGKKILPNDKHALAILTHILGEDNSSTVVQKILNVRFADLPAGVKPITKCGNKHVVAHWERGGVISDRVKDLIDFDSTNKSGKWSDIDGVKVTILEQK